MTSSYNTFKIEINKSIAHCYSYHNMSLITPLDSKYKCVTFAFYMHLPKAWNMKWQFSQLLYLKCVLQNLNNITTTLYVYWLWLNGKKKHCHIKHKTRHLLLNSNFIFYLNISFDLDGLLFGGRWFEQFHLFYWAGVLWYAVQW